jgi:hypothetical protein
MPQPVISKRCPSCGASIRVRAFFCPQCGQEITGAQDQTASLHDTHEIIRDGVTLTEADFQARQKPRPTNPTETAKPARVDGPSEKPRDKPKGPVGQRARGEVGARIHRATTKARDVEGNVVQRVQKFREISSVVLDEAGYDPSLRFVLVAAALFLLFIVIVLLNKVIG